MQIGSKTFWVGYTKSPILKAPTFYLRTPWWNLTIGGWEDRLFSERNGFAWCKRVGNLRVVVRKI